MVFPYLCVDLSLSEQIEHLSAAAHLALALYKLAGKDFIPTNLYIDYDQECFILRGESKDRRS